MAEDCIEEYSREIQAHFRSKHPKAVFLTPKLQELKQILNEKNDDQKKEFIDYISQQTVNKVMYKDWGERCVHKMNDEIDRVIESSQRLLQKVYYCQQNMADKEKEFRRMKDNLYDHVREIAKKLLLERQKEAGEAYSFSFSDEEIEKNLRNFASVTKRFLILNQLRKAPIKKM